MFQVPFPPHHNFVGRRDILAEIEAVIRRNQSSDECIPIVLKGLGVMGKTQLMLKYCYEHRKEYKYVIWINADGRQEILDKFRSLAKDLGIKVDDDNDDDDEALAKRIRNWFHSRAERCTLMQDN